MQTQPQTQGRARGATLFTPTLFRPGMRAVDALDIDRSRRGARGQGRASILVSILVGLGLGSFLYDLLAMKNPISHADQPPAAVVTIETQGQVVHVTQKPGESPASFAARVQAVRKGLGE